MSAMSSAANIGKMTETPLELQDMSARQRMWRQFRRQKAAMAGLCFLSLLVVVAILADKITPYSPTAISLRSILQTPSWDHLLGTDATGRDILSRMIVATRASLLASVEAVGLAVIAGVIIGVVSGYVSGWLDMLVMRAVDALISIPGLLMAMSVIGVLGPGVTNAMIALAIMMTPMFVRLARAQVLIVVEETYIEAARSVGSGSFRIIFKHLVPNIASPIIVQLFMAMGYALLAEGGLSYLGLSVQPPMASWGSLLRDAFSLIARAPWMIFVPGFAIMLTVLSFNLVGDGLRNSMRGRDLEGEWF